jgi:hypothetical protein
MVDNRQLEYIIKNTMGFLRFCGDTHCTLGKPEVRYFSSLSIQSTFLKAPQEDFCLPVRVTWLLIHVFHQPQTVQQNLADQHRKSQLP